MSGCRVSTSWSRSMARCPGCKPTMSISTAHRFDHETPLDETMQAFADLVRMGKVLYIGVSEWTAQQIQDGHDLAEELGIHLISNQPQYSMLWRVIEGDVVPVCVSLGISQIVFSPIAQGVLTGKYRPGEQPPTGSRATDEKGGADTINGGCGMTSSSEFSNWSRSPRRQDSPWRSWLWPGCSRTTTSPARSSGRRGPSRFTTTPQPPGSSSRKICWPRSMKCWIR